MNIIIVPRSSGATTQFTVHGCYAGTASPAYDRNTAKPLQIDMGDSNSQYFDAYLKTTDGLCTRSLNFGVNKPTVNPPIIPIVIPVGNDCNIKSFSASNIAMDSNVNVTYSCFNSQDANLYIFNPFGKQLLPVQPKTVGCNTTEQSFTQLVIPSTDLVNYPEGTYMATLQVSNCSKRSYFAVVKQLEQKSIPDTNLVVVAALFAVVLFIVSRGRKLK